MKKYSILVLLFLITGFCRSQSGWVNQPLPVNANSYDMKFFDANTGIVSLETPALLRTTNGGQNWVVFNSNIRANNFDKINDTILYAVAWIPSSMILRTFNKGATWDNILSPLGLEIAGLSFVNKDTGWVSAFDGNVWRVLKTINGGYTFQTQATNFGAGQVFFLKYKINGEYYGWVSHYNSMYKTTNSGVNWFLVGPAGNLKQLNMIDTSTGWASNGSVNILKTTNGGLNWVNLPMPSGNLISYRAVNRFAIVNKNIIYATGGDRVFPNIHVFGIIWVTTNGGQTWGFQQPDTSYRIGSYSSICFIDSLRGWAGSDDNSFGNVIKTTDGGGPVTKITNNSEQIPKDYELCQNYPNPFNPVTSISYKVKSYKVIKLSVYDIVGKEVAILFNEKQKAGEYEVTFDGAGLSSGVYYYVLYADGVRVGARRMVLLK